MLVKTYSCAVRGIEAIKISIEVNVTQGIRFFIVGLADNAIRESQQRIESALGNTGFQWPHYRVVINLAPADIRKEGTHFDLPLAMGILAATGQVSVERLEDYIALGELSLDGGVVPVKAVLPMVLMARKEGLRGVIVPDKNQQEASVVDGIEVVPVADLAGAVAFLNGEQGPGSVKGEPVKVLPDRENHSGVDFADVKGQEAVKRAMLIAAAGGHHLLLIGSPGSGKSMMARRLATIMPPMSLDESLQTTIIHSVAGRVGTGEGLIRYRPFRSPHHSSSHIALVGGGSSPQPGEISLAHNGVLFLDELPEFRRHVLEVLRQPLEDREIHVSRASYRVVYPSDFMLVAAMNPCPCGYYNHPERECTCGPGLIKHYLSRISGPLLDRIDIHMEVVPVPFRDLSGHQEGEKSESMRERVMAARMIQAKRFSGIENVFINARMGPGLRRKYCILDRAGQSIIRVAMEQLGLSARAYDRILKVARTISDLEESDHILASHVAEAVNYRNLDRDGWSG
ncbi:MAG: YifB family Mg chelatase-like AAA ATPase [Bacteroidales bacterium]